MQLNINLTSLKHIKTGIFFTKLYNFVHLYTDKKKIVVCVNGGEVWRKGGNTDNDPVLIVRIDESFSRGQRKKKPFFKRVSKENQP